MNRLFALLALSVLTISSASALIVEAPEIDPASGSAALAALSGAALIIRSRARR